MKNTLLTKIISMSLLLLVLISAVASCKGNDNDNYGESTGGSSSGEISSTVPETTGPAIDFSGIDYGGYTFTILRYDVNTGAGFTGIPNDIYISPEEATDILSSAVYTRNMKVSNELNVIIEMEMDANVTNLQKQKLALDILSGDPKYDLVITTLNQYPSFVNRGETLEIIESLELDTSYSWWDQDYINSMTVKGKLFALISDMTYMDKLSTNAVFVNATLAQDLQIGDLIKKVDDNTWTLDEMLTLAKSAEGVREGVYGLASQNDFSYYILHSAGLKAISNSNGELTFNLGSEKAISVMQKAYTIMTESYFKNRQGPTPDTEVSDFIKQFAADNDSLFLVRSVQAFYDILKHTTDYIVLPMPKYDESVENYSASVNGYSGLMYGVPISTEDTERTVNILQAMGMYSEQIVMPELYERVLGVRFAGNEDNARMLDIVFSNRIYDFGLYSTELGAKSLILKTGSFDVAAETIASSCASMKPSIELAIEAFYKKVVEFKTKG